MTIGVSHGGSNVYASETASTKLLVGTKNGVVALERSGHRWEVAHEALPGQHISSIVVEPGAGTVLAGAFFGSVHASTDEGQTWEQRAEGLTYRDVYSLAIKELPDGGVRAYAGTEPANLFQSDDLGRHWTLLPSLRSVASANDWNFPAPPHVAHTKFIHFSPTDPNVIYACIEQGALLRTDDLGETWQEVNTLGFYKDPDRPSEVFYDIHKLLIDPRDPRKLFVTGGAGLYVSMDAGASWERRMVSDWAKDVYPDGLVFDPRNPDVMFMSAAEHNPARWRDGGLPGYSGSRIYRSKDQGMSWELLQGGLPDRMREEVGGLALEAWDDGLQLFAATSAGEVWWSIDGGDIWSCIARGLGAVSKKGHDVLLSSTPITYKQYQPV
ncbi:MAG: WD40/YVTN/BNR-like repeat-containing protein [Chloroflexota bacterium]